MAPAGPRHTGPLAGPRGAAAELRGVSLRGAPPGPDPGRGLDRDSDGPVGRMPRAGGRPLADRGVQVHGSPVRRNPPGGLRLRAGPQAASRLLLPVEAPRTPESL